MLGFDGPEVDLDALVKVLQSEGEALDGREAAFFVNQVGGGTVPVGAVSGALTAFDTVVEAAERSEGDDDELAAPSATSGVSAVSMEAVPILPRNDSAGILSRSLGSIESGTDATFFPLPLCFPFSPNQSTAGEGGGEWWHRVGVDAPPPRKLATCVWCRCSVRLCAVPWSDLPHIIPSPRTNTSVQMIRCSMVVATASTMAYCFSGTRRSRCCG